MPYMAIACLGVIHAQKPLNLQALYTLVIKQNLQIYS